jgi:UDP-glucose:(glucosyl)LPS alpha-1,2-glucosyltransferase
MVDIINGEIIRDSLTANARGGTELIAENMVKYIDPELLNQFQIIHSRVRNLDDSKKKILVLHDLHSDPEVKNLSDPEYRKQFDKLVFVSDWQLQFYNSSLGVPYKESAVIHNAVEPFVYKQKTFDDTIRLVYHTTPHRGLGILVPVFEKLAEYHKDIHLDVYSSFKIYGWEERDVQYKALFDRCNQHPQITYHGTVSNEEIRNKLQETHIFAYPSIWPETSAISVIEAMYTGNIVVCPNYAALPETTGGLACMYQWSEDINEHANTFANNLNGIIHKLKSEKRNPLESMQYDYCSLMYNWEHQKYKWESLLKSLLN